MKTTCPSCGNEYKRFRFTVEDSGELFEYMGEAPKGFEHKWPDNDH